MAPIGIYFMQACSALSFLAAGCIMVTILRVKLFHKLFVKIIFFISLSDFFASLALMFGGTQNESAACYVQGITSNYFVLASFCWSAVICLQVHSAVIYGKVQNYMNLFYIFCWVLPLVVTLLPVSTSTYGNDESTPGWCFVSNGNGYPDWTMILWFFLGFYLWIWILIAYMCYVLYIVWKKFYVEQKGINPQAPVVVRRILGYPTIVVFCWTLPSILDMSAAFGASFSNGIEPLIIFGYVLPTIQGFLTAVVFFSANRDLTVMLSPNATDESALQDPLQPQLQLSIRQSQRPSQLPEVPASTNFSETSQYSTSEYAANMDPFAKSIFERVSNDMQQDSFSAKSGVTNNPIHKDVERGTNEEKSSSMTSFEVDHNSTGSSIPPPPSTLSSASASVSSTSRKHYSARRRMTEYDLSDSLLSTNA